MVLPAKKYYTPREYLALEEAAAYKSEYYKGEIFQMAGGTPNHNSIAANTASAFIVSLRGRSCRTFSSDQRVYIAQHDYYTYPDISIICGSLQYAPNRRDTVTNPVVVVEVLSKSTANYDRTTKFGFYRSLETLRTYILVEQDQVYVDLFQKNDAQVWTYENYNSTEANFTVESLGVGIALANIYENINFEAIPAILPLVDNP